MRKSKEERIKDIIASQAKAVNANDPSDDTRYVVWADHNILSLDGKNEKLKEDQVILGRDYPKVWIDRNLSMCLLILEADVKKFSPEELARRGYPKKPLSRDR